MKKINTVLFDLDGTLVDSNQLILDSFKATFDKFFPDVKFQREDYIKMIGPTLKETFSEFQDNQDNVLKMIDFYRRYYKVHEFDMIDIYPNLISTLKSLKAMGFYIGIVTTKFEESAVPSIKQFNLDQYMDVYIYLDDVKNPKPHAEPIEIAKSRLKDPLEILMVGDNPSDILSGKNAGVLTCGIEWSLKKEELKATNPNFWIEDYSKLIDIIKQYNKEATE